MRQAWVFSIAVLVTALSCALAPAAYAQGTTFTVTTTADHDDGSCTVSDCTLREAINAANANAGADAIAFGLTGGAPYVIRIESLNGGTESLPAITDPVTIDGTTEPGYVSGPPLVEIQSPVGAPVDSAGYGLVVEASNVTIRGLAIDGFFADITLDGRSCGGCGATSMHDDSLEDDYVGLDAAGGVAPALGGVTRAADSGWSQWGVQDRFANGTRIVNSHLGGIDGVVISVEQSNDTVIQGDTIGTDPSGSTAVPGASSTGIGVFGSSSNTQIGGANASPAGSCSGECNVIVATGIAVSVAGSGDGAQIQGNFIGVDASGATALCDCSGIATQVGNTTIGGTTPALRNVIGGTCRDSASSGDLVVLDGLENNGGDVVEGNYIGTDVSGTRALSPSGDCNGIATADNPVNAVIGGSTGVTAGFGRCTGACNLVSGALDGISVFGQGIRVEGNFVGTDVTGTRPIPNENGIIGGHGDGAGGDSIGGLDPAAGNLIAFNRLASIRLGGVGTTPAPPGQFNGGCGGYGPQCPGIEILSNSIHDNGCTVSLLDGCGGGNLNDDGDLDADSGANDLQNFPEITKVDVTGGNTLVTARLISRPSTSFELQFFNNPGCDTGSVLTPEQFGSEGFFGQGQTLLADVSGRTTFPITTNAEGTTGEFTLTFPGAIAPSDVITSTATDTTGAYTSEFSQCQADLSVTKSESPNPVAIGQTLTYTLTVRDNGPQPATGVELVDLLPPAETVVSLPSNCTDTYGPIICELGELGRYEQTSLAIQAKITDPGAASVTNVAYTTWAATGGVSDVNDLSQFDQALFDPVHPNNVARQTTTVTSATGTIVVKELTRPTGDANSFAFDGDASGTLADGGTLTMSGLAPGTYTSTQVVPAGWNLGSITCDDSSSAIPSSGDLASATATFHLDANETVTCTFTDDKQGTIVVKTLTDPAGAPGSFAFTGDASGAVGDGGSIRVAGLSTVGSPTYVSTETDPAPAFDVSSVTCDDAGSASPSSGDVGTRTASFRLDPGQTVTCTFVNMQRGIISVRKTVAGLVPSGSQSFDFQLRRNATSASDGTTLATAVANAANGGSFTFAGKHAPGSYEICEIVLPGWRTSLPSPFVPNSAGNPDADNSIVCGAVTLGAGSPLAVAVVNSQPPGGLTRTIGYWKNWASCTTSSARKKPVLDETLTLAQPAGITIGTLTLHGSASTPDVAPDCQKAVRLLNKSTIDKGTKSASDPAFSLAAQLLAAKLNAVAGAGSCNAAAGAIASGQALLAGIHFNGITHDRMTTNQATQATSLGGRLDDYNNDRLC